MCFVWLFVSVWSDTKNFLGCFDSYGDIAAKFFGSGGARFFCWLQEGQAFFGAVNFSDALDKLAGCTVSFLRIQLYNLLPHPWHHKTALKYPSNFFFSFWGVWHMFSTQFLKPFLVLEVFFKIFIF